jgi:hypothetical protein
LSMTAFKVAPTSGFCRFVETHAATAELDKTEICPPSRMQSGEIVQAE